MNETPAEQLKSSLKSPAGGSGLVTMSRPMSYSRIYITLVDLDECLADCLEYPLLQDLRRIVSADVHIQEVDRGQDAPDEGGQVCGRQILDADIEIALDTVEEVYDLVVLVEPVGDESQDGIREIGGFLAFGLSGHTELGLVTDLDVCDGDTALIELVIADMLYDILGKNVPLYVLIFRVFH